MFYTLDKYFENLNPGHKKFEFRQGGRQDFFEWQKKARSKLRELLRLDNFPGFKIKAESGKFEDLGGFTRQKLIVETEKDVFVPLYCLKPRGFSEKKKYPFAFALHGHIMGGKESPAGNRRLKNVNNAITCFNSNYGEVLAKKGFVVFAPDARGFGERREKNWQKKFFRASCTDLSNIAESLGLTLTGMFVIDLMRLLDFAFSLDYIDKNKVVCCGLSGGGLQSLYFSALDERITKTVISGYYYGAYKSLIKQPACCCNYVPDLFLNFDMCDIGSLIAPRGLFIETGTEDALNYDLDNALEQIEITKNNFDIAGAGNNFSNEVFEGGHKFSGKKSIEWLCWD